MQPAQIGAHELAMLAGGPRLAITTAAVAVRPKLITQPGRGPRGFIASGHVDSNATALERELLAAVRRSDGATARELECELRDCAPIRQIVADLAQAGLLRDDRVSAPVKRLRLAGGTLALVALAVVGLSGGHGAAAVALLVAASVAVVIFAGFPVRRRPKPTRGGKQLLDEWRASRSHLRDRPGRAELALAVALFGGAALWSADAAFAAAWGASAQPGLWWSGAGGPCGACGSGGACGGGGGCGGCG